MRKLRAANRDTEAERDRLQLRVKVRDRLQLRVKVGHVDGIA